MNETEVLIDTGFLGKLSCNGKQPGNFQKVLTDLNYKPVIHPYIAQNELDMYPYFEKLVAENTVRVAKYREFLHDEEDRTLYSEQFVAIHNELRECLELSGSKKQLEELHFPSGQNVFSYRKASMSLGDIHMILMAFYIQMPVILTEDSDIALLRSIARRYIERGAYTLEIYNVVDLLKMIAQNPTTTFTKNEMVSLTKSVGEKAHVSEVKQVWNGAHSD
ncbi:MAG: hypothetical protein LUE98_07570 [Tannerellaceae bacterium]|nr:hypothetical protein [Tannerellaceae bacterium]